MKLCPHCEAGYHDTHVSCPTHGGALSEIRELKPGMLIHKTYRIVRKLGQGGMGTVYLADHVLMEESRALKFLSAELSQDVAFTSRFRREVRTLRQVRHKNVVDCGDLEPAEDDSLFFPMEFVNGPDLRSFMRNAPQPFPVPLALALTHGIAEGLGAAHSLGMVHRDIKPENILMARAGDQWVPKIADFGIVATKEMSAYTQAGASLLTPFYAAPEQWRGTRAADLDGRTDLYALGGMLFELLTGQKVFTAENYEGWMESHRSTPPRPPSSVRPELAFWRGLDELVVRMLGKAPEDRPRDVAEVLGLLSGIQYVSPTALVEPPPSAHYVPPVVPAGLEPTMLYVPPAPRTGVTAGATAGLAAAAVSLSPVPTATSEGFQPVRAVQAVPAAPASTPFHSQPAPLPAMQGAPAGSISHKVAGKGRIPAWVWALCAVLVVVVAAGAVLAGRYYAAKQAAAKAADTSQSNAAQSEQPAPPDVSPTPAPISAGTASSPPQTSASQPSPVDTAKPAKSGDDKPVAPVKKTVSAEVARQGAELYQAQRFPEAAPLLEKACSGGDAASCKSLGLMYTKALGVPQNYPKAVQLYSKACNAGNAAACSNLGGMLDNGSGVAKDSARAATLYQKACDAGLANGCSNLGHSYEYGLGVPKDSAKAKELLQKGCSLGNQAGCEWLQKLQ